MAREKAEAAGVPVHLLQVNLTELTGLRDRRFDYAACLFSTLGMVLGYRKPPGACRSTTSYRLLRPGGLFVLHVHNRWFNVWNRPGRAWLLQDGWNRRLKRYECGDRVMPVHQGVAGLTLHLFTRREAMRLVDRCGFLHPRGATGEPAARWPIDMVVVVRTAAGGNT